MSPRRGLFPALTGVLSGSVLGTLAACGEGGGAAVPARRVSGDWPVALELPAEPRPRYERVVLVTIDTLRADHVSCYGYRRETTPFLDSLAAGGVLFERAMSTISHTAPSHSSLLTGLPPLVHGVLHNGYQLEASAVDLARAFAGSGFETAAFVNTDFLAGVATTFGHVEATTEHGEVVVDRARAWLEAARASGRFFLWVHLFDPHRWKDFAVEVRAERLWKGETPPGFQEYIVDLHGLTRMGTAGLLAQDWETVGQKPIELESVEQYLRFVDAYDALVLYADQQVKRLVRALERLELPGATLLVVTADHGEGLASHGTDGHGAHIYQEQLHVPFLMHASDGSLAARRVPALVSHLDLFPTLIETLGARVEAPPGLIDGRSLWALARGAAAGDGARAVFAQRKPTGQALFSLQDGRFKLLDNDKDADELYDLGRDPRELENLFETAADERDALQRALQERLSVFRAHAREAGEQEIPEAWLQELRDLGYVR